MITYSNKNSEPKASSAVCQDGYILSTFKN